MSRVKRREVKRGADRRDDAGDGGADEGAGNAESSGQHRCRDGGQRTRDHLQQARPDDHPRRNWIGSGIGGGLGLVCVLGCRDRSQAGVRSWG